MMKSFVLLLCLAGTFPEVIAREQSAEGTPCINGFCPLRQPQPAVRAAEDSLAPERPQSDRVIMPSEYFSSQRMAQQQRTSRRYGILRRCWRRVLRR